MSKKVGFKELLEAGVHFGHLKRKWNPSMAPYIFDEKKGIHIIDLNKTIVHLENASSAIKQIVKSGKKVLFVATKKQAKEIIAERMKGVNMPYVVERWSGGMLTNFATTRKSIRKMGSIDKMQVDGTWETLNKRERLFKTRQREKLDKNFGSIVDMTRLPAAIFVVDVLKEHIAVAEAKRLNIPTFAMVDTNSDPRVVDFPIPSNDDATKSIAIILDVITDAIKEALEERKVSKDKGNVETDEVVEKVVSKAEITIDEEEVVASTVKAKAAVKEKAPAKVKAIDDDAKSAPKKVAEAKKTVTKKPAAKKTTAKTEKK
jgi:small subunit ribosomal protein S2